MEKCKVQEIAPQLSSDETAKRLKNNLKVLMHCEELTVKNRQSLQSLATSLIQSFIQKHKSRDVKALAACCIAEVFRVFFPNPPYDEETQQMVFSMFLSQLKGLEKPSSSQFKQCFALLESLATVKTFNLCLGMDGQDIIIDLFKTIFNIVNDEQSAKVKMYLIDIMTSILQEGESLSQEVIEIILSNLVEPNKSEKKQANLLAVDFIKKASAYLEPYIQLFFSNAFTVEKGSANSTIGDHLFDLILELHGVDSSVLLSVMPQLEFKLKSSDVEERLKVTDILSRMFSQKGSTLSSENKPLWLCYLSRFGDIVPSIRINCVKYSRDFLLYHPHLVVEIAERLHERCCDQDESVRLEAVRTISEVAAENLKNIPEKLLEDLQERLRDKKWTVRREAMHNLAKLYRQLASSSSSGAHFSKLEEKCVNWMANKILHSYYQNSIHDRLCVERCVLSCLVPTTLQKKERMKRLLDVYTLLDENARKAFECMLKTRQELRDQLCVIIELSDDEDSKEHLLKAKISNFSMNFPDSLKCQGNLQDVCTSIHDDKQLKSSLLLSVNTDVTCEDVTKAKADILHKIGMKHGLAETVKCVLDRCSPVLFDSVCVKELASKVLDELCEPSLSSSQEAEQESFLKNKKGLVLLKVLCRVNPGYLKHSVIFKKLIGLVRHEDLEIASNTLQIVTLAGKYMDSNMSGCLQPLLVQLIQNGQTELTKNSIKCLSVVVQDSKVDSKVVFERLHSSLTSSMKCNNPQLQNVLIALKEIALLHPTIFARNHKEVVRDFVVKKLLVVDRCKEAFSERDPEWSEHISQEVQTKILGIKLLVCWLLGLDEDQSRSSQPVLRLLETMLCNGGDLQGNRNISASDCSRLRLEAACAVLKLARDSNYADCISQDLFCRMSMVMQDTCEEVRERFIHKLNKGLRDVSLPPDYMAVLSLAGFETVKDLRRKCHCMLRSIIHSRRSSLKSTSMTKGNQHLIAPEYVLPHVIYILGHHPDFNRIDTKSLDLFRDCIWFFLEPLIHSAECATFIRKMLETIKRTVDANHQDNAEINKNLYTTCDLALSILSNKTWPASGSAEIAGKIILPTKLFVPQKGGETRSATRYLPPGYESTSLKYKCQDFLAPTPEFTKQESANTGNATDEPAVERHCTSSKRKVKVEEKAISVKRKRVRRK